MRSDPLPPPCEEALDTLRVHELIRDFPELLYTMSALGVEVGEAGNETLPTLFPGDDSWAQAVRAAVSWREGPRGKG